MRAQRWLAALALLASVMFIIGVAGTFLMGGPIIGALVPLSLTILCLVGYLGAWMERGGGGEDG